MNDREQRIDERRFCAGCWAELGPADAFCPLCSRPGPPEQPAVQRAGLEPTPQARKTAGTGIGVEESQLRRQSLIAVLACALLLTVTVTWLEFQVNAFHNARAELGRPRALSPNDVPVLADFAGRWQVVEGPARADNAYFEFVMRGGKLVLPLDKNGTSTAFQLDGRRLRGAIITEQTRVDVIAVPTDDLREMAIWLYPSKGSAVKLRATRI